MRAWVEDDAVLIEVDAGVLRRKQRSGYAQRAIGEQEQDAGSLKCDGLPSVSSTCTRALPPREKTPKLASPAWLADSPNSMPLLKLAVNYDACGGPRRIAGDETH